MSAMIRFFCRKCAQRIKVQEVFAGRVVRCPKCGELQPSPTAQPATNDRPPSNDDIEPMGGYDMQEASEPAFPVDDPGSPSATDVDREMADELSDLASAAGLDGPADDYPAVQESHFPSIDDDEMDSAMEPPKRSQADRTNASQSVARSRSTAAGRRRKKKNRSFLIATIVLVVLMIGVIIAVAVLFATNKDMFNKNATPPAHTTTETDSTTETEGAPESPPADADAAAGQDPASDPVTDDPASSE